MHTLFSEGRTELEPAMRDSGDPRVEEGTADREEAGRDAPGFVSSSAPAIHPLTPICIILGGPPSCCLSLELGSRPA